MKILLTGPEGQIGWELRRLLPRLGELVAVPRSQMDLSDPDAIRTTIRAIRPDVIVNAAGYTAVDKAETEWRLAQAVNGRAPGIMAEEVARLGGAIVHYSTDYVFDGLKSSPYQPGDGPNPINVYGQSKLAGEEAIVESGADHLILRTSWVYSMRRSNFLLTMLKLAASHNEIRVVDDQHGCPSWSKFLAQATTSIISCALARDGSRWSFISGRGGIYHLACRGHTTWCGLARRIFASAVTDEVPTVIPITTEEYATAADRPRYSVLDCQLTEQTFGITLDDWTDALAGALREGYTNADIAVAGVKQ